MSFPAAYLRVFYAPSDQHLRNQIQLGIYRYFNQFKAESPTEADFQAWVAGLPPPLCVICGLNGLNQANQNLSFWRYVLEVRGLSLYDHMSDQLSADALRLWLTSKEYATSLHPNEALGTHAASSRSDQVARAYRVVKPMAS